MLTGKAKEDFKIWFENNYNDNFEYYHSEKMYRVLMTIMIDWFHSIGATEIGGHSISDMIHVSLQTGMPIFSSMKLAILKANENYNSR
jgi:hypothetical protein